MAANLAFSLVSFAIPGILLPLQTGGVLDNAVKALASPNVAYLLLVLGFLGLFL